MDLKEFHAIFLGAELITYTDNKNLVFATLNCFCVFVHGRVWSTIFYRLDKKNVITNKSSCLFQQYHVMPTPEAENAPVVLINFKIIGLDNNSDLLSASLTSPSLTLQTTMLTSTRFMINKTF